MCGRYSLASADTVLEELGLAGAFPPWRASFNVAPGQYVPCILNRPIDGKRIELLRWGLVPHWAEDPRVGHRMINARRETVADKPAFRDSYARRRCLVPADGFYEWRRDGKAKTPHYVRRLDGRAFAFAGLWASWKAPDESLLRTVAIVTAPAGDLVAPIHDRMPVIVDEKDYNRWLGSEDAAPTALDDILRHPAYQGCEAYEVPKLVNSVKNDGPELIERGPRQQRLF